MESKLPFGGLLEIVTIRPAGMLLPGHQMQTSTEGPYPCGFLLGLVQALPQGRT
jgi:hypothetical protein